jgi:hypothetical protein
MQIALSMLVVKGYAKIFGVDYSDTFLLVAKLKTIILLLATTMQKRWNMFELDVKSAFLNGVLQEEIYMKKSDGFVIQGEKR